MEKKDVLSVGAIVFLKSQSGLSLVNETEPVTSQNIREYLPDEKTVAKAIQSLQELGFNVAEADNPKSRIVTLTITGDLELFERVFKTKLIIEKLAPTISSSGGIVIRSERKLEIPDYLKETIDDVRFEEPVELFRESKQNRSRRKRKRPKIRKRKEIFFKI